jgi:hypothetical protein
MGDIKLYVCASVVNSLGEHVKQIKILQSSDNSERYSRMNTTFINKLRANQIRVLLANLQSRIFHHFLSCLKRSMRRQSQKKVGSTQLNSSLALETNYIGVPE